MCKFDPDQTNSHRDINKSFGVKNAGRSLVFSSDSIKTNNHSLFVQQYRPVVLQTQSVQIPTYHGYTVNFFRHSKINHKSFWA